MRWAFYGGDKSVWLLPTPWDSEACDYVQLSILVEVFLLFSVCCLQLQSIAELNDECLVHIPSVG